MHTNVAASRLAAMSDVHNYIDHMIPLHDFAFYSSVFVLKLYTHMSDQSFDTNVVYKLYTLQSLEQNNQVL